MAENRPRIPIAPVLSRASLDAGAHARPPSILDAGPARMVTSARVAIALALRQMGVGPGDEVLVPAWHSPAMVPPVLHSGAAPVFYRIGPDASADLDDIAARTNPATRALMVTHYFGFPQDLAAIRSFCDARGIMLLEDCAHSFFGAWRGKPVGAFGDYAVASSMKFFPAYEGGCLVSARHSLAGVELRGAGLLFEAKAALASLEKSFAYGRLPTLRMLLGLPMRLKDLAWRAAKARRGAAFAELAPASSDSGFGFEPRWLDKRSAWFSRLIVTRLPTGRIGALRRRHYLALERATRGLPGCRPLFPALPEHVYPWQFPLLVEHPEPVFARLHAAGVPVVRFGLVRWPGVDATTCANSALLSRRVLAFPCHQELREDELAWMAGELRQALLEQVAVA